MNKIRIANSKKFTKHSENFLVGSQSEKYKKLDEIDGYNTEIKNGVVTDKCVLDTIASLGHEGYEDFLEHFDIDSTVDITSAFFVYAHK